MPRICVEDLRVTVKKKTIWIKDLCYNEPSKILFLGETGRGKTILLKTFAGLNTIHGISYHGEIIVEGKTYYTPQEPWIVNLGQKGLDEIILYTRGQGYDRLREIYPEYRDVLDKKINEMSYGERRLLDIIKSLVLKPDIYFIDEPVEALDNNNRERILGVIDKLYMDGSIILATGKKPLDNGWKTYRIHNTYIDDPMNRSKEIGDAKLGETGNGRVVIGQGSFIRRGRRKIYLPQINLRPGEALTITAPNGYGKTSILLGISGSLKVKGEYMVKGSIGFVPDDINTLYPWMKPVEVVEELCRRDKECINESINILSILNVDVSGDEYFYEYSDGERRLIILIPQLIHGVDILLLDGGLEYIDYERTAYLEKMLSRFLDKGGIIVTTLPFGDELQYEEELHLRID